MTFSEFWNDLSWFDGIWLLIVIGFIALIAYIVYEETHPSYNYDTPKKDEEEKPKETKKEIIKIIPVQHNALFIFFIYWTLSIPFFSRKYFWEWAHKGIDNHLLGFLVTCLLWACTMSGVYIYKFFFEKEHERILTENKATQEKLKNEIEEYQSCQRGYNKEKYGFEREVRDLKSEISKLQEQLAKKAVILKTEPKKKTSGSDDGFEF